MPRRGEPCSIAPLQYDAIANEEGVLRAVLSSLAAFVTAGLRPRTALAKAIVAVLVIKLVGITAARLFMFNESAQPAVDAAVIAHVIGPNSPAQ